MQDAFMLGFGENPYIPRFGLTPDVNNEFTIGSQNSNAPRHDGKTEIQQGSNGCRGPHSNSSERNICRHRRNLPVRISHPRDHHVLQ